MEWLTTKARQVSSVMTGLFHAHKKINLFFFDGRKGQCRMVTSATAELTQAQHNTL